MSEETSTISHLSAAMTTDVSSVASSSSSHSSGIDFYFYIALVSLIIGVVGTATNGLIIYALVASKQHKKHVLILNQNALDLFTSLMMVITYSLYLCNVNSTGSSNYWLCTQFLNDMLIWCGTGGSIINLAAITIERYLKVVHPVWSKNKLRNWMIYAAAAFSWISGFVYYEAVAISTTAVMDGLCYLYVVWANEASAIAEIIINFVTFYFSILCIFIFCYWRILVVIRRQVKVMSSHAGAAPSTAQAKSNKIETYVTKTMAFVSAFFAIWYLPLMVYGFIMNLNVVDLNATFIHAAYWITTICGYLYTCTNPFVYAAKFDPVKRVLLRLIRYKKNSVSVQSVT